MNQRQKRFTSYPRRSRSSIEFWSRDGLIASIKSSMVPSEGSLINIRQITYKVERVTYALDQSDDPVLRTMRANVDLEKVNP